MPATPPGPAPIAPGAPGHVVVHSVDGASYRSLRQRATTRAERLALGRRLRLEVPRNSLGDWAEPAGRLDPVQQIIQSHDGRLAALIPVRVGRMVASPYGFLRGTPNVMAADFAPLPATGITPVICGDAHMGNFGSMSTGCTKPPPRKSLRSEIQRAVRRARQSTSDRALPRLTAQRGGRRQIVDKRR